ncbi:MAG: hypothetical protein OEU32_11815 [Acidimicrobiia bacterium]|nr:hypothetical protein [Acidimicrobiia bacterium]
MIELPEAETIRRDLDREIVGKKIKDAEVSTPKVVTRSGNRTKFVAALEGAKVTSVDRRSLHLLMGLDNDHTLVCRLGSGGLLRRHANKDPLDPKNVVVLGFTQGGQLRLIDHAGEAEMFVIENDELEDAVPELMGLGLDPIAEPVSWTRFAEILLAQKGRLKTLLCDDSVIVGIGDLYSDEILFNAGLRYDRMSDSLSAQEIRRFFRAVVETLHDAVKYRGTTLEDSPFVDVFGEPGSYQEHLNVYGKAGELSPRSRRPIARTKFSGRWTYYCEQSQV